MSEGGDTFEYSSDLMIWIWRIIIVTIIAIYIFVFTAGYLSKDIKIQDMEINSFKNRMLYSPQCLAYQDETTHPGTIDLSKFDEIRLNKCFQKNNFEFQLNLYDLNTTKIKSIASSIKFQQLIPLYNSINNIECPTSKEYVLVKDSKGEIPAILELSVFKNV